MAGPGEDPSGPTDMTDDTSLGLSDSPSVQATESSLDTPIKDSIETSPVTHSNEQPEAVGSINLTVDDKFRKRRRSVDSRASRCSVNSTKLKSLKLLVDKAVEVMIWEHEIIWFDGV